MLQQKTLTLVYYDGNVVFILFGLFVIYKSYYNEQMELF